MPAAHYGVDLDSLNYYTRDLPEAQRVITLDNIPDVMFFDALAPMLNKEGFDAGHCIEHLIKTKVPLRGKAHGDGVAIPQAGKSGYIPIKVPLAELIDNVRISRQAMLRATGMPGSWAKAVDDVIDDLKKISFKEVLRHSAIGAGNGFLARIYGAAVTNDESSAATWVRITCDNVYEETMWDNVALCQPGMLIECTQDNGTTAAGVGGYEIVNVHVAKRSNGASSTIQTTNGGYIDVDCVTTGAATTFAAAVNHDNYVVWRYGAVSDSIGSEDTARIGFPYPRGVAYWFMEHFSGLDPSTSYYTKYFALTRATYSSLQSRIYNAGDFGLDTKTAHTPDVWSLRGLSDIMVDVETGSGKGTIDTWMFNRRMGMAINARNAAEKGFQVVMPTAGEYEGQTVSLATVPQKVVYGDRPLRMICDEAIPCNTLIMFDSRDDLMDQDGSFDFLNLEGGAWSKSFDDRYTDFEAPFGGFCQFRSRRLDNKAIIQDLRDDI